MAVFHCASNFKHHQQQHFSPSLCDSHCNMREKIENCDKDLQSIAWEWRVWLVSDVLHGIRKSL